MTTTVVTAYYEIPSKFPSEKYWGWIKNFCRINSNLVIFTSSNLIEKFAEMRHEKTLIVPLEFHDLYHYQFFDKYREDHKKDKLNWLNTPELYVIWAEKVKFVSKVISSNPFSSKYFLWSDIGIMREQQFMNRFVNFAKPTNIKDGKMNMLLVKPFENADYFLDTNGMIRLTSMDVRIGGGIQASDAETWLLYEKKWDDMLQLFFTCNKFSGQDQCIINTIYVHNRELFNLIIPQPYGGDPWFYLLWEFSV